MTLGHYYKSGTGLPKDFTLAYKCFVRASREGNKEALLSLANCFEKGEGVKKNIVSAANLRSLTKLKRKEAAAKVLEAFPDLHFNVSGIPKGLTETKTELLPTFEFTKGQIYIQNFLDNFQEPHIENLIRKMFSKPHQLQYMLFEIKINDLNLWESLIKQDKALVFIKKVSEYGYTNTLKSNIKTEAIKTIASCTTLTDYNENTIAVLFRGTEACIKEILFEIPVGNNKVLWNMLSPENLELLASVITSKNHPQFYDKFINITKGDAKIASMTNKFLAEISKRSAAFKENYIKNFLENVTEQKARSLFSHDVQTLETLLFEPNKEGKNLWDILLKENKLWTVIQAIEFDTNAAEKLPPLFKKYPKAQVNFLSLGLIYKLNEDNIAFLLTSSSEIIKSVLFENSLENGLTLFQTFSTTDRKLFISFLLKHQDYIPNFINACQTSVLTKQMTSEFIYEISSSLNSKSMDFSDSLGQLHLKLLHIASSWGSIAADVKLGHYSKIGKGIPKDLEKAYAYFLNAAKEGEKEAFIELAKCYEQGEGIERNLSMGDQLLALAQKDKSTAIEGLRNALDKLARIKNSETITRPAIPETKTELLPTFELTKGQIYIQNFLDKFQEPHIENLIRKMFSKPHQLQYMLFEIKINGLNLWESLIKQDKALLFIKKVSEYDYTNTLNNMKPEAIRTLASCTTLTHYNKNTIVSLFTRTEACIKETLFEIPVGNNKVFWNMLSPENLELLASVITSKNHPQFYDKFINITKGDAKIASMASKFLVEISKQSPCAFNPKDQSSSLNPLNIQFKKA